MIEAPHRAPRTHRPTAASPKLRILHVTAGMSEARGGPPVVVAGLAEAQLEEGHHVRVVGQHGDSASVPVVGLGGVDRAWPGMSSRSLRDIRVLIQWADVVHIHEAWHFPGVVALLQARKKKKATVFTPHGTLRRKARRLKWWKKALLLWLYRRHLLARCHVIQALTPIEASEINSLARGINVVVIPNGVRAASTPLPDLRVHGRFTLVSLSRIHPSKNLEDAIEICKLVSHDRPSLQVNLLVCGSGPPMYVKRLRRLASGGPTNLSITFPGFVREREKDRILACADGIISTSRTEGMSISLLEAAAYGIGIFAYSSAAAGLESVARVPRKDTPRELANTVLAHEGNPDRAKMAEFPSWRQVNASIMGLLAADVQHGQGEGVQE